MRPFCLLLILFTLGCKTAPTTEADTPLVGEVRRGEATLIGERDAAVILFQDQFGVTDVTGLTIIREGRGRNTAYYLTATGLKRQADASSVTTLMRFPLARAGARLRVNADLFGESCTPTAGATCAFAASGGCRCEEEREDVVCNHTVVRGSMSR